MRGLKRCACASEKLVADACEELCRGVASRPVLAARGVIRTRARRGFLFGKCWRRAETVDRVSVPAAGAAAAGVFTA